MSRIGVFICHCGENIGATVDCIKVAELAANMEGVAYAVDYKYHYCPKKFSHRVN